MRWEVKHAEQATIGVWINQEGAMNMIRPLLLIMLIFIYTAFCSCVSRTVISEQIKAEAERVSFKTLAQETDKYEGKTVILGGYIIETKNIAGVANMTVLQTPLMSGEEPSTTGRSEGGFILSYNGRLEPEVYEKGRRATVAGKVAGRANEGTGNCPEPCLKLEYRQIYLWPMYESPSYLSDEEERSALYERWFYH
jgi:outer membrane lipoprotein